MDTKKKRGCNYTAVEKEILLDLIKKHQHVIENKETNARMIIKNREAWDYVCQQYNAVAVSGFRKWQQLRHLYENLKQRSKKNIAKINREKYYESTKEIEKKASIDKREISRTGGGSYKTILNEQDAQILAMVAPQIKPLCNPYDDAALYFGDVLEGNKNKETAESNLIMINSDDEYTSIPNITVIENSTVASNTVNQDTLTATEHNKYAPSSEIQGEKTGPTQTKNKGKVNNVKLQYFKAKLRNANIEKKYLINKSKMELAKHKLEIEILKIQLSKWKCTKNRKL